jgi:hypothetical protein
VPSRKGRGSQGDSYWTADNPPFGAVFTYHLKKKVESGPELDKKATQPEYEKLREKERTRPATVTLTIRDEAGNPIRHLRGSTSEGVHRTSWDLRYGSRGPSVLPGRYTVSLSKQVNGEISDLGDPEPFEVVPLALGTFQPEDREEIRRFHAQVVHLFRAVQSTGRALAEARSQLSGVEDAVFDTPGADPALAHEAHELEVRLQGIDRQLNGDPLPRRFSEPGLPGIRQRVGFAVSSWNVTAPPTQTQRDAYEFASAEFENALRELRQIIETDLGALKKKLDDAGVPWTPGRLPTWTQPRAKL